MITEQGDNLVFLLGIPRSGTTLLSVMLNNHPMLRCPPEPWLMLALESLGRTSAHDPSDAPVLYGAFNQFCASIDAGKLTRQFAAGAYNQCLRDSRKTILIDKTPRYYLILPFLRKLFPRARFIVLWRNPLDVAASMKKAWRFDVPALLGEGADHPACIDLLVGLRRLQEFSELMDSDCLHRLRYEELVHEPAKIIQELFRWLGVEDCSEARRFDLRDTEFGESRYGDQKILQTNEPHVRSIENWRAVFDPTEAETIVRTIGGQLLNAIGYGDIAEGVPANSEAESLYHRLEACVAKRRSEYSGLETYADLCLEEGRIARGLSPAEPASTANLLRLMRFFPDIAAINAEAANARYVQNIEIAELRSQLQKSDEAAAELHMQWNGAVGDRVRMVDELEGVRRALDDERAQRLKISAELDRAGMYAAELTHAAMARDSEISSLKHELQSSRDVNAELQATLEMAHQASGDRAREAAELANRLRDSMDARAKESSGFADRLRESAESQAILAKEARAEREASARSYLKWRRARRAIERVREASDCQMAELNAQLGAARESLAQQGIYCAKLQKQIEEMDQSSQRERQNHAGAVAAKNKAIEGLAAATRELNTRLRMLLTSRFMRLGWKLGFGSMPYWDDPARDELTGLADALMKQTSASSAETVQASDMDRALQHLVNKGFQPKVVLDIGAAKGYWTRNAAARWPAAQFFMIDPLKESEPALSEICRDPRFNYVLAAVGRTPGIATINITPDFDGSSCLEFPVRGREEHREISIQTVDALLADGVLQPPQLVKIDVQGFELEVLAGGKNLFSTAEVFILEASLFRFMNKCPRADEIVRYMSDHGFIIFDVAGLLRRPYENDLGQMDIVFVSGQSPLVQLNRWA